MNNVVKSIGGFAFGLAVLLSNGVYAQAVFSDFIAFGDSLSDTGNITSGLPDLPPPYFMNRITNGLVAVDYLSESIGYNAIASERGGNNYAVAGGDIVGEDREDLTAQIDDFLLDRAGVADPTALYFIMIGGNDLRDVRSQPSGVLAQTQINEIVAVFIAQLSRLKNAGAKRFFIPNLANIGRLPETLQREATDPGVTLRARQYSQLFNSKIDDALLEFATPSDVEIVQFDLYAQFESIIDSAADFGFTFTTIGCLDNPPFGFSPECLLGLRFDEFVFFDNIHPTRAANQLIGNKMVSLLNDSFLPPVQPQSPAKDVIPAILFLLLSD